MSMVNTGASCQLSRLTAEQRETERALRDVVDAHRDHLRKETA
jgi:hypothetical protein